MHVDRDDVDDDPADGAAYDADDEPAARTKLRARDIGATRGHPGHTVSVHAARGCGKAVFR